MSAEDPTNYRPGRQTLHTPWMDYSRSARILRVVNWAQTCGRSARQVLASAPSFQSALRIPPLKTIHINSTNYTVSRKKETAVFQYIFGICKDIFTIFDKQIPQAMSKIRKLSTTPAFRVYFTLWNLHFHLATRIATLEKLQSNLWIGCQLETMLKMCHHLRECMPQAGNATSLVYCCYCFSIVQGGPKNRTVFRSL